MNFFSRKSSPTEAAAGLTNSATRPTGWKTDDGTAAIAVAKPVFQATSPAPHRQGANPLPLSATANTAELQITNYSQVPSFLQCLTACEHPVYALNSSDQKSMVALECQGQQALILYHDATTDKGVLQALSGALVSKNYHVLPSRQASMAVIKEILDAATHQTGGKRLAVNVYQEAFKAWIDYAVKHRATDIHISVHGNSGHVKCRIDGEIEPMRNHSLGQYAADFLLKAITDAYNFGQKAGSGSGSIFKDDAFRYCMIPYADAGHQLNLRFQSAKGDKGPKVVLRLLDINPNAPTKSYADLGYAKSQQALWRTIENTPGGAVIIAGITGSGKTTTLKTLIESHSLSGALYTIEDPVEYPIQGAHQIHVQRDLANDDESAKRYLEAVTAIMRLDPDGIMIGEVRDKHSANALRQIAETGHVALGTLHAHLLSGIVPRLTNPEIGITRETLAAPNMLTALVYQALVPVLCPHCALDTPAALLSLPDVARIERSARELGVDTSALRWKRGWNDPCTHCNNRGTVGQTVVAEMFMPDEIWCEHTAKSEDSAANAYWRLRSDGDFASDNMDGKTVFEHTFWKALQGQVDLRTCERFDTFDRFGASWRRLNERKAQAAQHHQGFGRSAQLVQLRAGGAS